MTITHLSIALQKYRLKGAFGLVEKTDYRLIGEPEDLASAQQLADEDRYQFQWWTLSLIKARPLGGTAGSKQGKKGKKGSDRGLDGVITFIDESSGKPKRILVQVKSGNVKSGDIRDLKGTIERENAAMGVFLTLGSPSREMNLEAATAGFYLSPGWNKKFPLLQILTIEQLLAGSEVKMPPSAMTFREAERSAPEGPSQEGLFKWARLREIIESSLLQRSRWALGKERLWRSTTPTLRIVSSSARSGRRCQTGALPSLWSRFALAASPSGWPRR